MTLDFRPLSEALGAEVDLELGRLASPLVAAELVTLYRRHRLLLFRGQRLDMAAQQRIASLFGPLLRGEEAGGYVSNVRTDGTLGTDPLGWHSDLAYTPCPSLGVSLHAIDVVDGASATRFANAARAYGLLEASMRQRIDGLRALQISAGNNMGGRATPIEKLSPDWPQGETPLVNRHPATGESLLYVSLTQTAGIVGWRAEESEALLQELFGVLYAPGNVVEHRWRNDDFVIWDNFALQHARDDVSQVGARTLQRVALGEKGFFEMYPALAERYRNRSTQSAARAATSG